MSEHECGAARRMATDEAAEGCWSERRAESEREVVCDAHRMWHFRFFFLLTFGFGALAACLACCSIFLARISRIISKNI